uniref:Uncharacterized protein n=1 Tax=Chromera velia CCMP2878 TaxID=1169474 RepID=A0A0G4IAC0_9ALVE|eukprot:Cvel_2109.t1-p1 / transcript=Cvel_2109.t1 / gene=Cvel_2109 / organism=Chromera_velia_CCMP2878 / gene_product=hypothetical protein / transcript_product=hypothetical protein / location=Cvel_scaffold81:95999-96910(-) / protein_length=304 / sequence_SO=supercontig / SO=protein_coding / is_pseudo=false
MESRTDLTRRRLKQQKPKWQRPPLHFHRLSLSSQKLSKKRKNRTQTKQRETKLSAAVPPSPLLLFLSFVTPVSSRSASCQFRILSETRKFSEAFDEFSFSRLVQESRSADSAPLSLSVFLASAEASEGEAEEREDEEDESIVGEEGEREGSEKEGEVLSSSSSQEQIEWMRKETKRALSALSVFISSECRRHDRIRKATHTVCRSKECGNRHTHPRKAKAQPSQNALQQQSRLDSPHAARANSETESPQSLSPNPQEDPTHRRTETLLAQSQPESSLTFTEGEGSGKEEKEDGHPPALKAVGPH